MAVMRRVHDTPHALRNAARGVRRMLGPGDIFVRRALRVEPEPLSCSRAVVRGFPQRFLSSSSLAEVFSLGLKKAGLSFPELTSPAVSLEIDHCESFDFAD